MEYVQFTSRKTRPLINLKRTMIACCLALMLPGCDIPQEENEAQDGRFQFALIGDMPYDGRQEKEFAQLMSEIDSADLAFVIHAGDFWGDGLMWKETTKGLPPCSDETIQNRLDLAKSSRHPFILVLGDNDWTDCHRAKPRAYDPLERLAKLRELFFQGDRSLGQHTVHLTHQSEDSRYGKYRENLRWTYGNVLFVTLHMVGSNNNLGRTPEMDEEYAERNAADLAWMQEAFDLAKRNGNKAIMVIAHANPRFENTWPAKLQKRYMLQGLGIKPPEESRSTGFDDFLMELEDETLAFGKPVVYVHGDTHTFRVDKPLVGSTSGRMIENFTRVEVFGWKNTHWIRAIVDPNDPNVFQFRQQIVQENLVEH
jgi:predicted phosphodiesterase